LELKILQATIVTVAQAFKFFYTIFLYNKKRKISKALLLMLHFQRIPGYIGSNCASDNGLNCATFERSSINYLVAKNKRYG